MPPQVCPGTRRTPLGRVFSQSPRLPMAQIVGIQGSRDSLNSVLAFIPAKRIWGSSLWFFWFSLALCSLSSFLIFSVNSLSSHWIHSSLSSGVSLLLNTFSAAFSKSCIVCSPNPSIFCNFLLISGAAWFTNANRTAARDSSAWGSIGVYCLKASISLSRKAAGLSVGSCLTKFTFPKFVGFLAVARRPAITVWRYTRRCSLPSACSKSQLGHNRGNPSSKRCGWAVGLPSAPRNHFRASARIRSHSSVVKSTCNSCWQSSQVGLWVNKMESKRSVRPWGFSEKGGFWVLQLYRSLVERANTDRFALHPG